MYLDLMFLHAFVFTSTNASNTEGGAGHFHMGQEEGLRNI